MHFAENPGFQDRNLGRFRLSVTSDPNAMRSTMEFVHLHKDLPDSELAELNAAIVKAQALLGGGDEAVEKTGASASPARQSGDNR
jgi:hypothetical protein